VKRHKGKRGNIAAIEDGNGTIISDSTDKANMLNSYYVSIFSCDRNIPNVKSAHSLETFIMNTNSKSVEPDIIPGEILKLGGEAMIPLLSRLLEITLNNATIPSDWDSHAD
jgi:hypothetical protein